jgi:hypothetical protein
MHPQRVCGLVEITIKKVKGVTKMKLRTPKYLYTFIEKDQNKANKMIQAIPPSLQKVMIPKQQK